MRPKGKKQCRVCDRRAGIGLLLKTEGKPERQRFICRRCCQAIFALLLPRQRQLFEPQGDEP